MTGIKIGRLTVKEFSHIDDKHHAMWLCDCDCGNKDVLIQGNALRRNPPTQSCGCLQREYSREHIKEVIQANVGKVKGNKYVEHDEYYVGYDINNNKYIIDKDDYELVSKYTWHINDNDYFSTLSKGKKIYLHRLILGCDGNDGIVVDHINGNRFDCRKCNLRKGDYFINAWNAETVNKYGAKNIRKRCKYEVRCTYKNREYNLGTFDDINDAVNARIEFEKTHYNEYRRNDEFIKSE